MSDSKPVSADRIASLEVVVKAAEYLVARVSHPQWCGLPKDHPVMQPLVDALWVLKGTKP
ncbi:MAG: hypothetical protein FWD73_07025 [Polyangiaceae bacterium]|nr:hypothetical protein [Polyangiaceae bacterium]